jgi:hypothetical protein
VQCIFYMKVVPSGIKRFKQHLASGFGDTTKCARVLELVSKEMHAYLRKNSKVINLDPKEGEDRNKGTPQPSSGAKYKQAKKKTQASMSLFVGPSPTKPATQNQKESKSVSSMLCKTPKEVVAERHKFRSSHSTVKHCTKKGKEAK